MRLQDFETRQKVFFFKWQIWFFNYKEDDFEISV